MRRFLVPAVAMTVLVFGAALYLFEPWALWVNKRVDEPIPAVLALTPEQATDTGEPGIPRQTPRSLRTPDSPTLSGPPAGTVPPARSDSPGQAEPVLLATGNLITHEHATRGTVLVLGLADGSRILRFEDLDTSSGPDLRVWITDASVTEGSDGWHVFDDGDHVDLGGLTANQGNQNYVLPASVDLRKLDSVSIWCDRFNVSFGAAALG